MSADLWWLYSIKHTGLWYRKFLSGRLVPTADKWFASCGMTSVCLLCTPSLNSTLWYLYPCRLGVVVIDSCFGVCPNCCIDLAQCLRNGYDCFSIAFDPQTVLWFCSCWFIPLTTYAAIIDKHSSPRTKSKSPSSYNCINNQSNTAHLGNRNICQSRIPTIWSLDEYVSSDQRFQLYVAQHILFFFTSSYQYK